MTARRAAPRPPGAYTLLVAELIERRQSLRVKQRDLAPFVQAAQSSIAHYENGKTTPSAVRLVLWADALDCDLVLVPREEQ